MEESGVEVAALDADATLTCAAQVRRDRLRAECVELELAAHWADLHPAAAASPEATVTERAVGEQAAQLGGAGTPTVLEFAAAELGVVWHLSISSAAFLMADALDLRHRLPHLWVAVQAGTVAAWKARRVAQATRPLDQAGAGRVDAALHSWIERVSWGRFEKLLDARIIEADPQLAARRAEDAAAARFVRSRRDAHGLMTIIARATAGDGLVLMALVDRVADILQLDGDQDTADVRRSKAIGVLARPADALELLYAHRDDPDEAAAAPPTGPTDGPSDGLPFDDDEPAPEPDPDPDPQGAGLRKPPVDRRRVRPVALLHLHLSAAAVTGGSGVVRLDGYGPLIVGQLLEQLAALGCTVRLQPVIDLNDTAPPVDRYEIPESLRRQLALRQPGSVYPYSPSTAGTDLDHTIPWQSPARGGPPGQTSVENLGPLSRHEHRLKTFSHWRHQQPEPDTHLWRTPHGRVYLVNHDGTHDLGHGPLAQTIWRASNPVHDAQPPPRSADPTAA